MIRFLLPIAAVAILAPVLPAAEPAWVDARRGLEAMFDAMQEVHAKFDGNSGAVAQFGDSITYSMAFWSPMDWSDPTPFLKDDGLPRTPEGKAWKDVIKGARQKGPEHGNYSGWRVGDLLKAIDGVLAREKPEVALIMIGTNDISGGQVPKDYAEGLKTVLEKCLKANCVPILNTIPPRRGHERAVAEVNEIVRALAKELHVPLADYHAEITARRPEGTWDGTVLSEDGVHPSGGKTNDYSEENLLVSGYALRNWVNFLIYREVYFGVLQK